MRKKITSKTLGSSFAKSASACLILLCRWITGHFEPATDRPILASPHSRLHQRSGRQGCRGYLYLSHAPPGDRTASRQLSHLRHDPRKKRIHLRRSKKHHRRPPYPAPTHEQCRRLGHPCHDLTASLQPIPAYRRHWEVIDYDTKTPDAVHRRQGFGQDRKAVCQIPVPARAYGRPESWTFTALNSRHRPART